LAESNDFPFDSELFLDAEPMSESKRIPNIDIAQDGAFVFEMWCNKIEGRLMVSGDTVAVTAGPPTDRVCTPEQGERDADLLATFGTVTNWRRTGDALLLTGPKTLRFEPATH
jgi:heat shock protein HslJ